MPLHSQKAVAPFGERLHRSLPHTLPGDWFVLRTAAHATSRRLNLDVRSRYGSLETFLLFNPSAFLLPYSPSAVKNLQSFQPLSGAI